MKRWRSESQQVVECCGGCGRTIGEVPAYTRIYQFLPTIEIKGNLLIPARSATEASVLFAQTMEQTEIASKVQMAIGQYLNGSGKAEDMQMTYDCDDPQIPPPASGSALVLQASHQTETPPVCEQLAWAASPSLADEEVVMALSVLVEDLVPGQSAACVLHFYLAECRVPHQLFQGFLTNTQDHQQCFFHTWIEVETRDGWRIIDYGARQFWEQGTPHGMFAREDYPHLHYLGNRFAPPQFPPQFQEQLLSVMGTPRHALLLAPSEPQKESQLDA